MDEETILILVQIGIACSCFLLHLGLVFVTMLVANSKGRSGLGWGALAFFFSLLPFIILLFLPANRPVYPAPYMPPPAGYPGQPIPPPAYIPPAYPPAYTPPPPVHTPVPEISHATIAYSGPRLIVEDGPDRGKSYPLVQQTRIGRAPGNEIVLSDPQVSRQHAVIDQQGSTVIIRDLGGDNGIYVNGERIHTATPLTSGDIVTMGNTQIRVE